MFVSFQTAHDSRLTYKACTSAYVRMYNKTGPLFYGLCHRDDWCTCVLRTYVPAYEACLVRAVRLVHVDDTTLLCELA